MKNLTSVSTRSKNPKLRTRLAEESNPISTPQADTRHDFTPDLSPTPALLGSGSAGAHDADSPVVEANPVCTAAWVDAPVADPTLDDFLRAFHPEGGTQLRCFGSNGNANLDSLSQAVQLGLNGSNVFFLPNLGGQNKGSITTITALWIDVDAKDHPDQLDSNGSLPLPEWHLPPSAVVRSGSGGYHAYWILSNPIEVTDTAQSAAWFKLHQQSLAVRYGADPKVCDLPRVMRLPFTTNQKNGNPCTLESLNPDLRYHVEQIMAGVVLQAEESKRGSTIAVQPAGGALADEQYPDKVIKEYTIPYLNRITLPSDLRADLQGKEVARVVRHLNRNLAALTLVGEGNRNHALYSTSIHLLSIVESLSAGYGAQFQAHIREQLIAQLQNVGSLVGLEPEEVITTIGSAIESEVGKQATYIGRNDRVGDIKWLILHLLYPGKDRVVWRNTMDGHNYLNSSRICDDAITRLTEVASWYLGERAFVREDVETAIREMALDHCVNPFHEYLSNLPKPTGTAIKQIVDHYQLSSDGEAALRYGLHQAVGGVLGGVQQPLEVMPILCGGQRKGKTTLLRALFSINPLLVPVEGHFPDQDNKDTLLAAFQAPALIVDECADILRTRNVEAAKSMMSRRVFEIRMPYGKHAQRFTRCFTIWGTSNKTDFLSDETGNRRFLPIDFSNAPTIQAGTANLDIAAIRDDIWAEAVASWYANPTNRPPDEIQAQTDAAAVTHRATPEGYELVEELIAEEQINVDAVRSKGGTYQGLKLSDLQARIKSKHGVTIGGNQMGRILKMLGWENKQIRAGRRWHPLIG